MSATLSDVARRAGVSKATASRALNGMSAVSESTRERVARAADEIGYVLSPNAASLVTGKTMGVGVLTPENHRWFSGAVLRGAEGALLAHNYDMTLYTTSSQASERSRMFSFFLPRGRYDGLLAISTEPSRDELRQLDTLGIPLVAVGGPVPGVATYGIDDFAAAHTATKHLIELGHRKIAYIGSSTNRPLTFSVLRNRWDGHVAAMCEAGLSPIMHSAAIEMTQQSGFAAASAFLALRERPTAFVTACDEIAFGALLAAQRASLSVPHDLSVIGIDGHELAELHGLTTIEQFPGEQGRDAANSLLAMIRRAPRVSDGLRVARTRLTVRSSTGPAGAPARHD